VNKTNKSDFYFIFGPIMDKVNRIQILQLKIFISFLLVAKS